MLIWISLCALALSVLLIAERSDRVWAMALSKPVAALSYIALAIIGGALESVYGLWVFIALCFSFGGDVLLIPKDKPNLFLAGIASFWLAHVTFAIAFWQAGISPPGLLIGFMSALVLGVVVWRWLRPYLSGVFEKAVPAYIAAICVMLMMALSASHASGVYLIVIGAMTFIVSDIFVARDRFIDGHFNNRLYGLPLYFFAQILLAYSVAEFVA